MAASERPLMMLYPYGPSCTRDMSPPATSAKRMQSSACSGAGGPFPSVGRFIEYAQRIPILRDSTPDAERSMVLLTATTPVKLRVLEARRTIEAAIPALARALWVLFVDPRRDPLFVESAARLGALDGELSEACIWRTVKHGAFLVLSPGVSGGPQVRLAAHRLRGEVNGATGK